MSFLVTKTVLVFAMSLAVFTALPFAIPYAQAQTFNVLHTFAGAADGANPVAGLTTGGTGTLYGTAEQGGTSNDGVVFALKQHGGNWTLNPLHEFSGDDGRLPQAPLTIGPNGALFGTTSSGGEYDYGAVYQVQPPATACKTSICYWNESVIHSFYLAIDEGAHPFYGKLIFDQSGNVYGTTAFGGFYGAGVAYELTAESWNLNLLHSFDNVSGSGDGFTPLAGLVFDAAGNLYGTTQEGGPAGCSNGCGTVIQLSPSSGSWTESILYPFNVGPSGYYPNGTLALDPSGSFYGTTFDGGAGQGTVFNLTPSDGGWAFSIVYTFGACHPYAGVTIDPAGDLYGTCSAGGADGLGLVYKLTNSGGSWTFNDLHDFTGGSDGANPSGAVVLDGSGNVYGTAPGGGNLTNCSGGCGTVWSITP